MNTLDIKPLIDEITYWKGKFNKGNLDDIFYELSFFKIYIKFEQFLISSFIHYAIGGASFNNYYPKRKLQFTSFSHLEGITIYESKKYLVEKPESINQLSKHIFDGDDNPFESMFSDARFNDALGPMRILRNFIAHGSQESLQKYCKLCNENTFIEPFQYLLKKNKTTGISNYTNYVQLIETHCSLIYNYNK